MKTPPPPSFAERGRRAEQRPTRPRAAFTLIELLTVITIVGILAGIILVAVGKMRHESRLVTSTNRMRNLGVAYLLCVNDNRQKLLVHPTDPSVQASDHTIQTNISPYLALSSVGNARFYDPVWWDAYAEINGVRAGGTGEGQLYWANETPPRNKMRGFYFNYYVRDSTTNPLFFNRLNQVQNPSRLALMFSRRADSGSKLWNVWADGKPYNTDNPASYGAKRLIYYFDGHVEREVITASNYNPSGKFQNR